MPPDGVVDRRLQLAARAYGAAKNADVRLQWNVIATAQAALMNHASESRRNPKHLHDDGWYIVTTRGSHRQLKHPTKPGRVTVHGKPSEHRSGYTR